MNLKTSKSRGGGHALAVLGLASVLLATSGGAVHANSSISIRGLEPTGTWGVQVTLRDCASGTPLGEPFPALVTFHEGGTISEGSGGGAFAAGQNSSGHGTWVRRGPHTFRQRMIILLHFDTAPNLPGTPTFDPSLPITPGFFAGWYTVTQTARLTDADHLTSAGTNAFYKSDGTVYSTGCSTAVGQRFR